jgi:hypothetical protein
MVAIFSLSFGVQLFKSWVRLEVDGEGIVLGGVAAAGTLILASPSGFLASFVSVESQRAEASNLGGSSVDPPCLQSRCQEHGMGVGMSRVGRTVDKIEMVAALERGVRSRGFLRKNWETNLVDHKTSAVLLSRMPASKVVCAVHGVEKPAKGPYQSCERKWKREEEAGRDDTHHSK